MRRACLVGAGACFVVAAIGPPSGAQETDAPMPEVFRGAASSMVASVQIDRDALIPVPEIFKFIVLDGESSYESSNQTARASLFFPGNGVILGPSLACSTAGAEFPEEFQPVFKTCLQYEYPLTVFADDAFNPDDATSGSLQLGAENDPISMNAIRARAHAALERTNSDAAMQDLRVLGLPFFGPVDPAILGFNELDSTIITVDNATSRTDQRIVDGGLVTVAEATLSGVRMIGGLLEIGSIRSRSVVTDPDEGAQTSDASLEVSGVTVAGVPAQITEDGLVVGEPAGDVGPIAQQVASAVNALVQALDLKITLLPTSRGVDDELAFANVGGVLVEFSRELRGAPTVPAPPPIFELDPNGVYKGSFVLGATGARGIAASFDDDFGGGDGGVVPPFTDTGSDRSLTPDLGPVDTGDLGDVATPGAQGEPPTVTRRIANAIDALFADRLKILYLAFTLVALGLCVTPRLTIPARLGGSRA